jgi:molybdopterin-biosynthesis enzyme MoeA-like protein
MLDRKPRFIFITGGLGPTKDDQTIEALSKLTGRLLVIDQNILKTMAKKRNLSLSQLKSLHFKMSTTIEGARCLPNPLGWAPLTICRIGETVIFTMPGPPKEMKVCFTTYLVKEIEDITHYHSFSKRVVVTMFETEVEPLICQIQSAIFGVYLKPLVGEYIPNVGLPVEIIVFDSNDEECHRKYNHTLKMLIELVKHTGNEVMNV